MQVKPIIDRDYFNAIYYRQPQGILLEQLLTPLSNPRATVRS